MTTTALFLGDELSAAGFRLGGIEARTPPAGAEVAYFEQARREALFVLITAEFALRLPSALLQQALNAGRPLVAVLPDVRGRSAPPDLAAVLRRQLGMET
jgi:vacuolar-type H+-ATPase subunit F/Vma7